MFGRERVERDREGEREGGKTTREASTFWSSLFAFIANFWLPTVQPISCQAAAQNDNPEVIKKFYFILTFSVIVNAGCGCGSGSDSVAAAELHRLWRLAKDNERQGAHEMLMACQDCLLH